MLLSLLSKTTENSRIVTKSLFSKSNQVTSLQVNIFISLQYLYKSPKRGEPVMLSLYSLSFCIRPFMSAAIILFPFSCLLFLFVCCVGGWDFSLGSLFVCFVLFCFLWGMGLFTGVFVRVRQSEIMKPYTAL